MDGRVSRLNSHSLDETKDVSVTSRLYECRISPVKPAHSRAATELATSRLYHIRNTPRAVCAGASMHRFIIKIAFSRYFNEPGAAAGAFAERATRTRLIYESSAETRARPRHL
ncbi:hypothetical protein EVAR_26713_1 [Eumeta japonica]|uniref:Uncharacterized protein n=1 Tax=Eumeta variegata TaxID=151549 RepID=A0A4C1ZVE8_EUMVA|nr:hypothetical protein EVAR_26713_1 [Eumeta japonica]